MDAVADVSSPDDATVADPGTACEVMGPLRDRLGATPQLVVEYEPGLRTLWVTMAPRPHPRLTEEMTDSFLRLADAIRGLWGNAYPATGQPVKFAVIRSDTPDAFSSGGDLSRIVDLLEAGDMEGVRRYFHNGTRSFAAILDGFGASVVTVASVSGMVYGGGFEAARACDFIVAEPSAKFGFPEWRFGLFPGNGAFGIVGSRHGEAVLKRTVLHGEQISVEEALALGIVDRAAPEGGGDAAARELIEFLTPRHAACLALRHGMRVGRGPTPEALVAETERYLASIGQADVRSMRRLVALQDRVFSRRR